jgi:hypothetical protein
VDSYKYDPEKGYLMGLPARDIPVDEWKSLPEELTDAALKLKMYRLVKEAKEVKDVK